VLHPRFKWTLFEKLWGGPNKATVREGKRKLKDYWETHYKAEPLRAQTVSPEPESRGSFLEEVLEDMLPTVPLVQRPTSRQDQLALYLLEPRQSHINPLEY
jgi:hypothetical protein